MWHTGGGVKFWFHPMIGCKYWYQQKVVSVNPTDIQIDWENKAEVFKSVVLEMSTEILLVLKTGSKTLTQDSG